MAPRSDRPHMDPRLMERIKRKKAQLDSYRPLPPDTVHRLNEDLRVFLTYHSNAGALTSQFDAYARRISTCPLTQ